MDAGDRLAIQVSMMGDLYGRTMSDAQIVAYVQLLGQYDVDAVVSGIGAACKRCRFLPTVSEILAHGGLSDEVTGEVARRQAHVVLDAIRTVGAYGVPIWDDPVTARIVARRWRWRDLCINHREADGQWFVKEFCAAYDSEVKLDRLALPLTDSRPLLQHMTSAIGRGSSLASK